MTLIFMEASPITRTRSRLSVWKVASCRARSAAARQASRNVGSFDCPRFIVLEGAVDGEDPLMGRYEFIVAHRVPNEPGAPPAAYGGSGLLIDVASTAWRGRAA